MPNEGTLHATAAHVSHGYSRCDKQVTKAPKPSRKPFPLEVAQPHSQVRKCFNRWTSCSGIIYRSCFFVRTPGGGYKRYAYQPGDTSAVTAGQADKAPR